MMPSRRMPARKGPCRRWRRGGAVRRRDVRHGGVHRRCTTSFQGEIAPCRSDASPPPPTWIAPSTARFTAASTMSCTRSFRRSDCSVSERCISSAGASAGEPTTVSSARDTTPCTTSFRWRPKFHSGWARAFARPPTRTRPKPPRAKGDRPTLLDAPSFERRERTFRVVDARGGLPRGQSAQTRPEMDRNRRKRLAAKCVACANVGINFHASPVFIF